MNINEMKKALLSGQRNIDGFTVDIEQGSNFRYHAYVSGNGFNTIIETPSTVDAEGIVSFVDRLAYELKEL